MRDTFECYKILELPPGAPAKTVRKAYIALCQVWHPDRFVDNPILRAKAAEKMADITEAYETLRSFLPELQGKERASVAHDRDADWDLDDGLEWDRGLPLRKVIFALLLVVILLLGALGALLYFKQRSLGTGPSFS